MAAKNLLHAEIADKVNYTADKIYFVSFVQRFEEFKYIPRLIVSFKKNESSYIKKRGIFKNLPIPPISLLHLLFIAIATGCNKAAV